MGKIMLSADGDVGLYKVDKQIYDHFDDLLEQFYQWKKTSCYDEQLFVKFLRQRYGDKAIRLIENLGWSPYDSASKDYENIKWYNF